MMKSSLIRINLAFILLVLFIPSLTSAETKTFIKEYTYQASEEDSRNSSRTIALREVKRLLLEELGTYLESVTEVRGFKLTKDQITTLTAGIVKTEIVEEKWDGRTYWLKSKIAADSVEVIKAIDALRKDREKTKQLEEVRKRSDELLRENEKLRKELTVAKGEKRQEQKADYDRTIKDLTAIEWYEKGYAAYISGNNSDAIAAFSNAIEANPKDSAAYSFRGDTYAKLDNFHQALEDYNRAIEIDPKYNLYRYVRGLIYSKLGNDHQAIEDFSKVIQTNPKGVYAYYERGRAYANLDNYHQALEDYDRVIEIEPTHEDAYLNRGLVYANIGNYNQAIKDYNRAIELNLVYAEIIDPDTGRKSPLVDKKLVWAYDYRGMANAKLGNPKQAIKDFGKAIKLNPKYADAYFNRGNAYADLGNYKRAIKDYNESVKMNPKDTVAYYNRGNAYGRLGNHKQAIEDKKIAARLGLQEAQDFLRKRGIDWTPEGVADVTSSDKPPQKPEKNAESSLSATSPDKTQHKPVKNIEPPTEADDSYKGIKAIVLKNGNVIEGKILSMDPEIVKIRTKDGKVLSYSFKNDVQTFITK